LTNFDDETVLTFKTEFYKRFGGSDGSVQLEQKSKPNEPQLPTAHSNPQTVQQPQTTQEPPAIAQSVEVSAVDQTPTAQPPPQVEERTAAVDQSVTTADQVDGAAEAEAAGQVPVQAVGQSNSGL